MDRIRASFLGDTNDILDIQVGLDRSFAGADLVIVNTCGFIDDAVKESLDTIAEALAETAR